MNTKNMKLVKSLTYLFAFLVLTVNCIDQDFDEPPIGGEDPNLAPTMTIGELKAMHNAGQDNDPIVLAGDDIIKGVCNSSDESGNIFKQISIQDETGGILIRIDRADSYTEFAPGRNIFVKLKDLALGDFNGTYQLGKISSDGTGTDRIPDALVDEHIIPGKYNQPLVPKVKTIPELDLEVDQNTLVTLNNVEFVDFNTTYGIVGNGSTQNRTIRDCNNNEITMRNSDFATFAGEPSPTGQVNMKGIFSVFGSTKQFTIRSLDDVKPVDEKRCDGSTVGGGGDEELMTIAELKSLGTAPSDRKIAGTVVSDWENGNTTGRNIHIQDATGGIVVRFDVIHTFALNSEIEVVVSNLTTTEFGGLTQIEVGLAQAKETGSGSGPTPLATTIDNIKSNISNLESTVIKLENATISGGSIYNGNLTITDASGSLSMFTRSSATFANNAVPSGEVDITAVVTLFQEEAQIFIRNADDVEGGTVDPGGDEELMTIADLKSAGTAPAKRKIAGTVVSDYVNGNTTGRNIHIQDATGGIVVRFGSGENHTFQLNSEIEVVVSSLSTSEFGGLTQVEVSLAKASQTGTGSGPTPVVSTISNIKSMTSILESTVIKLENVTLSGSPTYQGNLTVSNGNTDILMFTRDGATFSGETVPTTPVDLTAVVTLFQNEAQIFIRNLDDVE